MDISGTTILPVLKDHLSIWQEEEGTRDWSLELTEPHVPWSINHFTSALQGLRSIENIKENINSDTLEVIAIEGKNAGYALVVQEQPNITHYCYANSHRVIPKDKTYFENRTSIINETIVSEFPFNVKSVVRQSRPAVSGEIDPDWDDHLKLFHIIKSFEYTDSTAHIKYVVRMFRGGEEATTSMADSTVTIRPIQYKFSMHILPSIFKDYDIKKESRMNELVAHVIGCLIRFILIIRKEPYLLNYSERKKIIESYKALIKDILPRNFFNQGFKKLQDAEKAEAKAVADLPDAIQEGGVAGKEGKEAKEGKEKEAKEKIEAKEKEAKESSGEKEQGAKEQGDPESEGLFMLTPKPVTLEKCHLIVPGEPNSYGVIKIQTGYAVTDKADGERMLLFINDDGDAYLLDSAGGIRTTGYKVNKREYANTLIDGEYISFENLKPEYQREERDIYAAFDIYFINRRNVMELPLINGSVTSATRYNKLVEVLAKSNWEHERHAEVMSLIAKKHIMAEGNDMFKACREIIEHNTTSPYYNDGLIFTPTNLAVFGNTPNGKSIIRRGGKWERVLKWKPAEQNTIDFLVRKTGNALQRFQEFELFTGYNPDVWEPRQVWKSLLHKYDFESFKKSRDYIERTQYIPRSFRPVPTYGQDTDTLHIEKALFPVDNNGRVLAINGDIINDGDIVELGYDRTKTGSERWIPHRVRYDKVMKMKKRNGDLSGTANDFSVAMNIWRSIHDPVTKAMIIGDELVAAHPDQAQLEEAKLGSENIYYDKQVSRERSLSYNMLQFHNHGIKSQLYKRAGRLYQNQKKGVSLLELACGKGGDMNRWFDNQIQFVLGMDLVKDNIQNPKDGAYARLINYRNYQSQYLSQHQQQRGRPQYEPIYVFVVGDVTKRLVDGEAAKYIDKNADSEKVLKLIYGPPQPRSDDKVVRTISGKAQGRFDMVSCQFAIHYFFEEETILDSFLANVSENLRPGGIFIGTCMDGSRVNGLFSNGRTRAEGRSSNKLIWAIFKDYDQLTPEKPYHKKIDVFLEMTNQTISEYLVDFDTLVKKANQHDLYIADAIKDTGLFEGSYQNYVNSNARYNPSRDVTLDPIQKQFSFLNRWFVFTKIVGNGQKIV